MTERMRLPFIIGEAGSVHEETLGRALRCIETAKAAECDAIKYQFWSDPARMRERRHVGEGHAYDIGSVKESWMLNLRQSAHDQGLLFACSLFLPEDVEKVSKYFDFFKVSSFEARDRELTREIQRVRGERPLFISTGMQESHDETYLPKVAIKMHCTSAYPCPLEDANLGAIEPHGGYSDHTRMVLTGAFAVSAGADYLEVHFRLDDTSEGCPDKVVSLSPTELKGYVRYARTAAVMRGTGLKTPQESEREYMRLRVVS